MDKLTITDKPQIAYSECCTLPFVSLYNEDCIETMKRIPDGSIDLMLTDPPYNVTDCDWDKPIDILQLWPEWERILKPNGVACIFSQQPFSSELIMSRKGLFRYEWIWEKSAAGNFANANKMPLRKHENVLIFYRSLPTYNPQPTERSEINKIRFRGGKTIVRESKIDSDNYNISHNGGTRIYDEFGLPNTILAFNCVFNRHNKLHPTQKPVDLMRYLILTYSNKGETVFDGYSGSGTTAEACMIEQRNFIGSELNKEYFDKSVLRLKNVPQSLF